MRRIAALLILATPLAAATTATPANAAPPRIIGGAPAAFAAWPWQVAVLDGYTSDRFRAQLCGGTLIAPNVVLTAAHCLYDEWGNMADADDIDVLTGTSRLGPSLGDRSPIVGGVVFANTDDMWDSADLAVLWAQHTSPRAIPLAAATLAQAPAFATGRRVTVAGWGVSRIVGRHGWFPRKLKQYAGIIRTKARGFLMIRSLTSSACFGDSGGPAVGRDVAGAPYLVGVVHAGASRCPAGQSVMFVNVAAQQAFIQQALAAGPQPGMHVAR